MSTLSNELTEKAILALYPKHHMDNYSTKENESLRLLPRNDVAGMMNCELTCLTKS